MNLSEISSFGSHSATMEVPEVNESSISEWYQKQTVLVTGGSGFLGKALLFKLVQIGCPRTYLLLRPKKGQTPQDRLNAIFDHEIFDSIRENVVDYRSKVVPILGDTTAPNLGMSDKDRELICETTTVVFHGAASVKFDDSLREAVHNNLKSTRDLVELGLKIKNIKIFVYISTGYSNSERMMWPEGCEEKIYEKKMNWEKLIDFIDTNPDEVINSVEQKIVGASSNTYIFTKNLSESLIQDYADRLPMVVTRPPIVNPAYKEPYPGWMDNISSPVAIIGGSGKGVLRLYIGTPDANKSYTPVDFCTNCHLVAAWHEALNYQKGIKQLVPVYNQDSCAVTTGDMKKYCFQMIETQPIHNALWHTHFYTTNNRHLFTIGFLILHCLPALIIDLLLKISGQRPRMLRIYRKLHLALMSLLPILNLNDNFVIDNYNKLKTLIPKHEREIYYLDVPNDPSLFLPYLQSCCYGFRRLIGDPPYPTEKDFQHQRRLKWIDMVFRYTVVFLLVWCFPFRLFSLPFFYIYNSVTEFIDSI